MPSSMACTPRVTSLTSLASTARVGQVWGEPGSGSGDGGLSAGWKAFAYIGGPLLGAALVAGLGVVVWRTWRRAQRRGSYDELAERDLG